jgi:hypothetical protein
MSYALPSDMLVAFDARTLGQLCSDNNAIISPTALLSDPNLQAALDKTAGEIDAALLNGGLYKPVDLAGIITAGGTAAQLLIGMNCMGAMVWLYRRRPMVDPKREEAYSKVYRDQLDLLQSGKNIFNLPAQQAASQPTVAGLSLPSLYQLNGISTRTRDYYPPPGVPCSPTRVT